MTTERLLMNHSEIHRNGKNFDSVCTTTLHLLQCSFLTLRQFHTVAPTWRSTKHLPPSATIVFVLKIFNSSSFLHLNSKWGKALLLLNLWEDFIGLMIKSLENKYFKIWWKLVASFVVRAQYPPTRWALATVCMTYLIIGSLHEPHSHSFFDIRPCTTCFFHPAKGYATSISYVGHVFQLHPCCLACLYQLHTSELVWNTMSNVRASFATLTLSWLAVSLCVFTVVPERLQLQQQRQSEPQHVANPNTSMQCTTVGLPHIYNPKSPYPPTVRPKKVRHRKRSMR